MKRSAKIWYLAGLGFVYLLVVGILFSINAPGQSGLVRATALLGYLCIFTAIVSASFVRELARLLGRQFLVTHHIISGTGLVLIILHPLAVALSFQSASVFVPHVESLRLFLTWGGPPALYLTLVGYVAVRLRKQIKFWRSVHYLNYLAFLLATVHALLLGTDTIHLAVKIVAIALAIVVVGLFVRKRLATPARPKAR